MFGPMQTITENSQETTTAKTFRQWARGPLRRALRGDEFEGLSQREDHCVHAIDPGSQHVAGYHVHIREPPSSRAVRVVSDDVIRIGESALYPALQRLLLNGWVKAEWGTSENNRRARYYTPTAAGRRQLTADHAEFDGMVRVIQRVLAST